MSIEYEYVRFGATLSATVVGASLAFFFNSYLQRRKQKDEDRTAGSLALLTIDAQLDELMLNRYALRKSLAEQPAAFPEWLLGRPMSFAFSDSNGINFESLAFLLTKRKPGLLKAGREAFAYLQILSRTYSDMRGRQEDFCRVARDIQEGVAQAFKAGADDKTPYDEMAEILGSELTFRSRDHLRAIALRMELDEGRCRTAYGLLNSFMGQIFGESAMIPIRDKREKFESKNLPPWPMALKTHLDGRMAEISESGGKLTVETA